MTIIKLAENTKNKNMNKSKTYLISAAAIPQKLKSVKY